MNDLSLRSAFEDADVLCRRFSPPASRHLYFRALAALALGDREACLRDLRQAAEGPSDPDVLDMCLRLDPDVALARAAFALASPGDGLLRRAAAVALRTDPLLLRAERTPCGFSALVACRAGALLALSVDGSTVGPDGTTEERFADMSFHAFQGVAAPSASPTIDASVGRHRSRITLPPREMRCVRPPSRPGVVSVVVPVHGGRAVTRSCLDALARQACRREIDVVVVDDACPDPDLAAEAAATAAREGWRHLRNRNNLGFAAAVNAGAALTRGADILLLNADAILPPGAIDRLLEAAAAPDVGTVVPLSNDAVFTSFPTMRRANPAPDEEEARRIDAAARRAAGPRAVDIPAGTAFCMLVAGRCWDALGGLDLGYGRGYYEDVDLCLRARRIGFRNVLAPALYVRHLGGQSFGGAKRSLVADNARLLFERFPDYDGDWMAFAEGDPLAAVRDGIERRLPPTGPVHLVAGRGATPEDAASLVDLGPDVAARLLLVQEDGRGGRRLRAADGGVPQTLRFSASDGEEFLAYLRALSPAGLSLVDPSPALLRDLEAAVPRSVPVWVPLTGPRSLRLLDGRSGLSTLLGRARPRALDGMGRAALGLPVGPLPPPRVADARRPRLAALVPRPTVEIGRTLAALDRAFRARGGEVVILGEALGDRAAPVASGAMASADYPDAFRHRDITHVLLPDADAPFRLVEGVRRVSSLPAAYVDWAPERHRAAPGDLALHLGEADAPRIDSLVAWAFRGLRDPRAASPRRAEAGTGPLPATAGPIRA